MIVTVARALGSEYVVAAGESGAPICNAARFGWREQARIVLEGDWQAVVAADPAGECGASLRARAESGDGVWIMTRHEAVEEESDRI